MSATNEIHDALHPFVTQLLYVAAHDQVALDGFVQEFALDESELDEFDSWVKLRGFASAGDDSEGNPVLQITPEGTKWVLGQLWDYASGEYTGEV